MSIIPGLNLRVDATLIAMTAPSASRLRPAPSGSWAARNEHAPPNPGRARCVRHGRPRARGALMEDRIIVAMLASAVVGSALAASFIEPYQRQEGRAEGIQAERHGARHCRISGPGTISARPGGAGIDVGRAAGTAGIDRLHRLDRRRIRIAGAAAETEQAHQQEENGTRLAHDNRPVI